MSGGLENIEEVLPEFAGRSLLEESRSREMKKPSVSWIGSESTRGGASCIRRDRTADRASTRAFAGLRAIDTLSRAGAQCGAMSASSSG